MSNRSVTVTVKVIKDEDDICYPVNFSETELQHAIDVVYAKACLLTNHDNTAADDLASDVFERLFDRNPGVKRNKLDAYLRVTTRNVHLDKIRAAKAKHRKLMETPVDISEFGDSPLTDVIYQQDTAPSPSQIFISREQRVEMEIACALILHSLPERKRRLIEMAADHINHQQIAEELGFASADVVKVTLNRVHREVRSKFANQFNHFFVSSWDAA